MRTIRFWFSKTGRAKYISHLDLMRAMTRTLRRSGLPLWYTEGFHPHLYLTFGQPLSLGFESDCEAMEVRVTGPVDEQAAAERLNALLPPGLRIYQVCEALPKLDGIAYSEYAVTMEFDEPAPDAPARFKAFCGQERLTAEKKGKGGVSVVDLKPHLQNAEADMEDGALRLRLTLPSGQALHINPTLITNAFLDHLGRPGCLVNVRRTEVLDQALRPFGRA